MKASLISVVGVLALCTDVELLETYYYSSQPLNFSNWNHNFSQMNFQTYWAHLHEQQLALQQPYNDKLQQFHSNTTHEPSTTTQHPVTSSEHPVTSSERPVMNHKPVVSSEHPVMSSEHPVTSSEHPVTSSEHPVTSSENPVTNSERPVLSNQPETSSQLPMTTSTQRPTQTTPSSQGPYVEQVGLMRPPMHEEFDFSQPDSPIGYSYPCGLSPYKRGRIVGGSSARPGEFPWQVSLQLVSGWSARHVCGGAIVADFWVATAAHCIDGLKARQISVVAGDHNLYQQEGPEQRVSVVRIVTSGYSAKNFSHDIALLQLERALIFDGLHVAPICLPQTWHTTPKQGWVTGWGRLAEMGKLPHELQKLSLPLVRFDSCRRWYVEAGYGQYLNSCQLCFGEEAGGFDSCQGDSGGPMACLYSDERFYLCGVVSWGVGCARAHLPGVYTDTTCFVQWMKSIIYNENNVLATGDTKVT